MTTVKAHLDAPVAQVWATLVDATTYPKWLIGARRIRRVEDGWPAPGTAFHHEVGPGGPLTIADLTRSLEVEDERLLKLDVRARPLMRAEVTFLLRPLPGGTEVTLEEHPVGWHRWLSPLIAPMITARNKASLEKLGEAVRRGLKRA